MKTKGIGPNNLGAPKGVGKMMISPAKKDPPSKKEMDYIVAENAKKDKKRASKNDRLDGINASKSLKNDMLPRTDANFNRRKKAAAQERTASYGFPESVSSPAKQAKENPISKAESFNMFRENNQLDRNGRQQKTNYSKSYQNKKISNSSGGGSIGDTERDIVTKHQYNAVRGNAVKATAAKENKFGIKKPKVNIK